jgi:short-subunit dehydrogenase
MRADKTALITGASRGIGLAFARLLAEEGYDLILTARSEEAFYQIKQEIEERFKVKVMILPIDLTIPLVSEEIHHLIEQKHLHVDVLINNAGFGDYGKFWETDFKKERNMIQLNIVALTHLTKLFLPHMIERGCGRILNVASVGAFEPGPLMSVFFATQAYVLSFSQAVANECKGTGVSVTALCPGPTESGFQSAAKMQEARIVKMQKLASAASVARYGYRAMLRGKTVAIPGFFNKITTFSVRLLPRNVLTSLVHFMHRQAR